MAPVLNQNILDFSGNLLMNCRVYRMEHAATKIPAACTNLWGDETSVNSPDQYCYKVVLQNLTTSYLFHVRLRFLWHVTYRPLPPVSIPWTDCNLPDYVELFTPVAERLATPEEHSDCNLLAFNRLDPSPSRVVSAVTVSVNSSAMETGSKFRVEITECDYIKADVQQCFVMQQEQHVATPPSFFIEETVV
jgi:hypothetical protein